MITDITSLAKISLGVLLIALMIIVPIGLIIDSYNRTKVLEDQTEYIYEQLLKLHERDGEILENELFLFEVIRSKDSTGTHE